MTKSHNKNLHIEPFTISKTGATKSESGALDKRVIPPFGSLEKLLNPATGSHGSVSTKTSGSSSFGNSHQSTAITSANSLPDDRLSRKLPPLPTRQNLGSSPGGGKLDLKVVPGVSKYSRTTWKLQDDYYLLHTVLTRRNDLLRIDEHSIPVARFWENVSKYLSEKLTQDFQQHDAVPENVHRNPRQCKDRFYVLFHKTIPSAEAVEQQKNAAMDSDSGQKWAKSVLKYKFNRLLIKLHEVFTYENGLKLVWPASVDDSNRVSGLSESTEDGKDVDSPGAKTYSSEESPAESEAKSGSTSSGDFMGRLAQSMAPLKHFIDDYNAKSEGPPRKKAKSPSSTELDSLKEEFGQKFDSVTTTISEIRNAVSALDFKYENQLKMMAEQVGKRDDEILTVLNSVITQLNKRTEDDKKSVGVNSTQADSGSPIQNSSNGSYRKKDIPYSISRFQGDPIQMTQTDSQRKVSNQTSFANNSAAYNQYQQNQRDEMLGIISESNKKNSISKASNVDSSNTSSSNDSDECKSGERKKMDPPQNPRKGDIPSSASLSTGSYGSVGTNPQYNDVSFQSSNGASDGSSATEGGVSRMISSSMRENDTRRDGD